MRLERHAIIAGILGAGLCASAHAQNCPADCNGDGSLDILDFVCFQQEWQQQSDLGDCDGNGQYNILDFVCYQQLFQAGCGFPEILDVFPLEGPPGTLVNIVGVNLDAFGDDPDDLCMVADGGTGFQVVRVQPDLIQAVALPMGPNAVPGEIMIAFGDGDNAILDFPDDDGDVVEPVWCWTQPPDGPVAAAGFVFEPVPDVIPTDVFPGVLEGGDILFDLSDADWQAGDKIRIVARAWCELRSVDCVLPTFRLTSDANPNQCALAICALITKAYEQLGVTIDCFVGPGPVITLSYPDCDITRLPPSITSVIERTPCPPDDMPPVGVESIKPLDGKQGDIIQIRAQGLTSPVETCIQVVGGCPIRPILLVGGTMIAEIGPVPPGAQPGPVLVARGVGTLLDPADVFIPGLELTEIGDGFQGAAFGPDDFVFDGPFEPGGESPKTTAFKFSDGVLIAELTDDWETGDKIRLDVHFNADVPGAGIVHFDCFTEEVCLTAANPDVNSCATVLCALIQQCFAAQNPPVDIECNTQGGTIFITAPDIGPIVSGGGTINRH